LLTIVASVLSAFGLYVFVFPASFAPSGVDGIATMLQETTGLSAGVYSLIINIPLLIVAWFILKKRYVIYTVIFTVLSSLLLVWLQEINFYHYPNGEDRILAAIFSGVMLGVRTGIMLRFGASTGGVDIVAGIVQKKSNFRNIERIITIICYVIIGLSYFVYRDVDSILYSIVQMFIFEKAVAFVMKDTRNAVEFKIITKNPQEIREDIIYKLKHGATIIESKGMYSETPNYMVISVMNSRDIPEFMNTMKKHPDTFVYFSDGVRVQGDFHFRHEKIGERIDAYQ
jgi:uncharacterized membrane-anchored protein YitT (DUF2179 family)